MDGGSWHCTGDRDQDHPHGKEMQESKMAVWGGLTNSCEKKISKKQKRKGKISSVQSLSHVRLFATPWIAACQASLSITNSWSLLRLTSIDSVMPSSRLILCRPLLLLPPIPPSIRVFSILFLSSISLHWSLRKAFFSLLAILWNSAFRCLLSFLFSFAFRFSSFHSYL